MLTVCKGAIYGFIPIRYVNRQIILMRPGTYARSATLSVLSRIRNEQLIIEDTLDHFSQIVDGGILIYDDCSTDATLDKVMRHKRVYCVVANLFWRQNRQIEETQNRKILLEQANRQKSAWILYLDADERIAGNVLQTIRSLPPTVDSVYVTLFDAYMTPNDKEPYNRKTQLLNFRAYFGPEYRTILMLWRNLPSIYYEGIDRREPAHNQNPVTMLRCQHYGKSLSEEHWESTCDYYAEYFPEPYKSKWEMRRGKSVHNGIRFWEYAIPMGPGTVRKRVSSCVSSQCRKSTKGLSSKRRNQLN